MTQLRSNGISTTTFPYAAWLGGFTIVVEMIFILVRMLDPESFLSIVAVDALWAFVMFILTLSESVRSISQSLTLMSIIRQRRLRVTEHTADQRVFLVNPRVL
jgi:hypothetical protein